MVVVVVAVDFEGFVVVVVEEEEDGCRGLATTGGRVDGRCGESIIWGETFLTDEMLLRVLAKKVKKRNICVFDLFGGAFYPSGFISCAFAPLPLPFL